MVSPFQVQMVFKRQKIFEENMYQKKKKKKTVSANHSMCHGIVREWCMLTISFAQDKKSIVINKR